MSEFFIIQFGDSDDRAIGIQTETFWIELFTESHLLLVKEVI